MEVSTDGVIKLCKNKDSCYSTITNMEDCDMIVEIKCSYPNNHNLPVHYSLPKKYVTQMLAGMKCKRSLNCIYVCYSKESTTFFKCKFDNDLWKILWLETKDLYDTDECKKPVHLQSGLNSI